MLADRFMHTVPGAWPARAARASGARRLAATVRTTCAPANLALAAALVGGWLALIAWTGAGPESWQARLCTNLDGSVPACGTVGTKVQGRVAPHLASARIAS